MIPETRRDSQRLEGKVKAVRDIKQEVGDLAQIQYVANPTVPTAVASEIPIRRGAAATRERRT